MENINKDDASQVRLLENFIEYFNDETIAIKEENGRVRNEILAEKMEAYNAKHIEETV